MKQALILLSLLCCTSAGATDLSLKQALQMSLEHSHALKKSAALDSASLSTVNAAKAERWPTLSLSGTAQVIDNVPVIQLAGQSRELGSKETYQTDLRLSLPIFTGGKIGYGIDLARASHELQSALAKGDSDRVAYTAWSEYLGLTRAQQMVAVAEASQKRAEIINRDVQSLVSAGVADSVDLNDAKLALTRAQLGVKQANNQLRTAEIRTAILIGADPHQSITPATAIPEPPESITSAAVSLDSKSEIRASTAAEEIARAKVHLTIADFLPTLSGYGGYSYGKPNGDFFNNKWRDFWSAGANLSWSFNLGGRAQAKNKSSRYELRSAQSEQSRVAEQLDREVRLAGEQLSLARDRYESARTEFQIAGDQFRLAQQRHQNGDLSSNRLLDIETSLTSAQSSLAASLSDYWLAMAYWYFCAGSPKLQEGF